MTDTCDSGGDGKSGEIFAWRTKRIFRLYVAYEREREMYQRYLQALSLIYSKDGVLSTEMGRLCVEVLRKN